MEARADRDDVGGNGMDHDGMDGDSAGRNSSPAITDQTSASSIGKRPWEGIKDELETTVNQIIDMIDEVTTNGEFDEHPVWAVVSDKVDGLERNPSSANFETLKYFVAMRELMVQLQERKAKVKDFEAEVSSNAAEIKKTDKKLKAINEKLADDDDDVEEE